jgi:hypothetical protein
MLVSEQLANFAYIVECFKINYAIIYLLNFNYFLHSLQFI